MVEAKRARSVSVSSLSLQLSLCTDRMISDGSRTAGRPVPRDFDKRSDRDDNPSTGLLFHGGSWHLLLP